MKFEQLRKHRGKILAAGIVGAALGMNEVRKIDTPGTPGTESTQLKDSGPSRHPKSHRQIERSIDSQTIDPDFEKMNFGRNDLLDLSKTYQPVTGFEDNGWNPYGSYDQYLRGQLEANPDLAAKYRDIVKNLEWDIEADWLHIKSEPEHGGLDVSYQIVPSEYGWVISEYLGEDWAMDFYQGLAPYQQSSDLKDHVLQLIKSKIEITAAKSLE